MKKLYFAFLLLSTIATSQVVNIPDANFKNKLIALGIDTNTDGQIQAAEAMAVTSLSVNESNITDMTGISAFTNLVMLECYYNHELPFLDVSALVNLTYLDTRGCALASLNVSGLSQLQVLTCWQNQLTSINLSDLGSLQELSIAQNMLTDIDLTGMDNLVNLQVQYNDISNLDLSGASNLKFLGIDGITDLTIDLSAVSNLETLLCNDIGLTNIDLSPVPNLKELQIAFNNLSTLDLSPVALNYLKCEWNQLTALDISQQPLIEFNCSHNQLTAIDASSETLSATINFHCSHNLFTEFDASALRSLFNVSFGGNPDLQYVNLKTGSQLGGVGMEDLPNLMYICADQNNFSNIQGNITYFGYTGCSLNAYCSFTPGGAYNTINGTVSYAMQPQDCGNTAFSGLTKVQVTGGASTGTIFSQNGSFTAYAQNTSVTIAPQLENPEYFTVTPPSAVIAFPAVDYSSQSVAFCIQPNGVHADVEVMIVPTSVARPGFDAHYELLMRNKGNVTVSGAASLGFDTTQVDFASSTPAANNATPGTLFWNYSNLLPYEVRTVDLTFNVHSPMHLQPVNIDDELLFIAQITSPDDENVGDNNQTLSQIVVGSLDPNDKRCMEGNIIGTDKIGDYLHYVINFENVGTYPAENVVIADDINASKFDLASFQMISASHPVAIRIKGNKIEFIFEGINLGVNELGHVIFKIKTKNTLAVGSTVSNKANIFFDYNFPIETNLASTTFQALDTDNFEKDHSVIVSPNPVADKLLVNANSDIKSVELYDVQGRLISVQLPQVDSAAIEMSACKSGVYFAKVSTSEGVSIQKVLKK